MEYKQIIRDLMNSILIADPKTEIGGIPITEDSINDIIAESKVWTEDSREFYIEELKTIAKEKELIVRIKTASRIQKEMFNTPAPAMRVKLYHELHELAIPPEIREKKIELLKRIKIKELL